MQQPGYQAEAEGKLTLSSEEHVTSGYGTAYCIEQDKNRCPIPDFEELLSTESSPQASPHLPGHQPPEGVLPEEDRQQDESTEEDPLECDIASMGIASRCKTTDCQDLACKRGKEYISKVELGLFLADKSLDLWKQKVLRLLYGLIKHAMECSDMELACTVPMCVELNAKFPGEDLNMGEKVEYMLRVFGREPIITDTRDEMPAEVNFRGGKTGHVEMVDYKPYRMIRKLGEDCLCYWNVSNTPGMKFILQRTGKKCLEVLHMLLDSPSAGCPITQHHWVKQQDCMVYVAKEKYDRLLSLEVFMELGVRNVLKQLVNIAAYVQSRGLALLDWSPENFSVDEARTIQLYDVTACVLLDELPDYSDIICLAQSLPPAFVPPELWAGFFDKDTSTMWGLGILLCYLDTAKFHVDMHDSLEDMRRKLKMGLVPDTSSLSPDVKFCVDWLLKEVPRERRTPALVGDITADKQP